MSVGRRISGRCETENLLADFKIGVAVDAVNGARHVGAHDAREYGYGARILEASLEVNRSQRQVVIQKLQERLFILKGRSIALLGLAFKPETDDLRDAPSLQIAERLLRMGARVRAYDPVAMDACRRQNPDRACQ